jgi:hypothetical protein
VSVPLKTLCLQLTLFALAGCGPTRPPLDQVTRVVTIGDSASTSPWYEQSFVSLLYADLGPRLGGAPLSRLERPGDSYHALAVTPPKLEPGGTPLVIVQLGFNDMLFMMLKLFFGTTEEMLIADLRVSVRTVLQRFVDAGALIVVVDAYDPSDGVGDITEVAADSFPLIRGALQPEVVKSAEASFRRMLREEADRVAALYVSVHDAFLGHGFHGPPTDRWLRDLFDPTLRGAHEMRRAVLSALTGESVQIPAGLVEDDALTIPPVPVNGWANAVVSADVTQMIDVPEQGTFPNIGADPNGALGEPGDHSVAIGIAGASIVVDLGANEGARDEAGADLVVLEQGGGSAGVPEPYRVYIASAPGGPFTALGDGRGARAFFLRGTPARYIKIESGAHLAEVGGGFGSPLYPGPEIRGIGAVHPGAP